LIVPNLLSKMEIRFLADVIATEIFQTLMLPWGWDSYRDPSTGHWRQLKLNLG
jgi:hypothetical protein